MLSLSRNRAQDISQLEATFYRKLYSNIPLCSRLSSLKHWPLIINGFDTARKLNDTTTWRAFSLRDLTGFIDSFYFQYMYVNNLGNGKEHQKVYVRKISFTSKSFPFWICIKVPSLIFYSGSSWINAKEFNIFWESNGVLTMK